MEKKTELLVVSPWYLQRGPKSKKYAMSLNTFLGMDKIMCHLLKNVYKSQIAPQLRGCILKTPVEVSIKTYTPSRRKSDKGNFYALSAKFLYDAMTDYEVWEDDNDSYLKTETILPSEYDKNNGRIEFLFKSIESIEEPEENKINW